MAASIFSVGSDDGRLGILKPVEGVATQLSESAGRFARDCLAALSPADDLRFALYAATSIEHLLKCYLARKHPALIVDARSLDSLLHACGQDAAAKTKRDQVKTISAAESLTRASRFLPLLKSHTASLEQLIAVRNGAVHLAEGGSVQPFVFPFLKASELLREALELDRDDYWGEYVTLADTTLREHVEAAELRARAAVGAAKIAFAKRFGDLEEKQRATALTALEPNVFWGDEEQRVPCPACNSTALATGTVDAVWHYEQIGDDDFQPYLEATFIADGLRCNICGLELKNDEELRAVGVKQSWEIEVDPEHYIEQYEDYEPDEDWYRNR